ncbi:MAG: LysM peptidoglycan-binding domain-containing protein [Anaerolineales bacterium]|nr:LysM peptidoglycan-binding domain-containing protein [Anaerolineales bacterium]
MTEKTEKQKTTRTCPVCGTKLTESAERCLVCGTTFFPGTNKTKRRASSQITLSLPLALVMIAVFTLLAAGATYAALRLTGISEDAPTETPTITLTPTVTNTLEPTATDTPEPTWTPLPPIEYSVVENDTCIGLAVYYEVSVRSITDLNNLGTECFLVPGQTVLIPQPTLTSSPTPTVTLEPIAATEEACEKLEYIVEADNTLFSISLNYAVSMEALKLYNNMNTDVVYEGQPLIIPLCEQVLPNAPTSTPTPIPPYPAPNLLLPQDGQAFTLANDTVTLQWASVGTLRDNEFYRVTVVDVTEGSGDVRITDEVKDTKYIVPVSLRPAETAPHVFRWSVITVRQTGSDPEGKAIFEIAGSQSTYRVFSWSGAVPAATPES